MTQHAVSIRPICFSMKTSTPCRRTCRTPSSRPARKRRFRRGVESKGDSGILEKLEKAGKLKRIKFEDRDRMKKLVDPVMEAYAKEIGADAIHKAMAAI
jgi:hypothetical protein